MEDEIIEITPEEEKTVTLKNVRISHLGHSTEDLKRAIKYLNEESNKVDEVATEIEDIRVELVNQEIIPDKYNISIENEEII